MSTTVHAGLRPQSRSFRFTKIPVPARRLPGNATGVPVGQAEPGAHDVLDAILKDAQPVLENPPGADLVALSVRVTAL
jgi:hypothetical protein